MTATFDFDRLLVSVLEADGPQAIPQGIVDAALGKARSVGQRKPVIRLLDRRAWPAPRISLGNPAVVRVATLGLVLLLTFALIAAGLFIGSQLSHRRAPPILTDTTLPGAWSTTADAMKVQRNGDASATLHDGRVLFVGGEGEKNQTTVANLGVNPVHGELFDPSTNAFESTVGMMSPARDALTATTLADGRVLVAGGFESNDDGSETPFATSELFDPGTGTFSPTGDMVVPRAHHTATLLPDGRVLAVGGGAIRADGTDGALASAEVYDPRTGRWTTVGQMSRPRIEHTATLLGDGTVLIAGGWYQGTDGSPVTIETAELFNPSTAKFEFGPPMIRHRARHTATLLADGRVLIAGGYDPSLTWHQFLADAELYDPASKRFRSTGALVTERSGHSAVVLHDGRVLVAGGSNTFDATLSAEIYDPAAGTFEVAASVAKGATGPASALADGRVLIAGTPPQIFDPRTTTTIHPMPTRTDRTFVATGGPLQDRSEHTAIRLVDGRVLIVGGREPGEGPVLASAELYDPRTGSFSATGSMGSARSRPSALLLQDGRVMIAGGASDTPGSVGIEMYDPASGRFTTVGSLPSVPYASLVPVQLRDGRVVVIGGNHGDTTPVYGFDLTNGTADQIGTIPGCGGVPSAVALADDKVLALCRDPSVHLGSVVTPVLLDPGTGRSTALDLGWRSRDYTSVQVMADGRVLFSGIGTADLGVYDRVTATTVEATSLVVDSSYSTAAVSLLDGRVLITTNDEALLWDPDTGASEALPAPVATRQSHTETLLNDGRVLIVGGTQWPADHDAPHPAGAELFDPANLP